MSLLKFIFFVVAPLLVAYYVFFCMDGHSNQIPTMTDGWWGEGPAPKTPGKEQKPPVPFRVTASKETLDDLRYRLEKTRFPESIDGTKFQNGFNSDFLRHVVSYWKSEFNWEKQEAKLNELPQFITKIEGIDVHFVRVIPKNTKADKAKRVIMLVHGWPGSFWEFYKIIPLLTETKKDEESAPFEVICPSIPGYGFSEAPHQPGFDGSDAARVFFKLMKTLGHDRFYVQGGDWGGIISTIMAQAYPKNVIGVHLNFALTPVGSKSVAFRELVAEYWPSLIYSPEEMTLQKNQNKKRPTIKEYVEDLLLENGYFHIQATKPDTVAAGLNDSPAGLAAYILEKFSTWTNQDNTDCSDGCITKYFTLDEVLTNVMIYWLSGNVGSSMRFYKEFFFSPDVPQWDSVPILVPTGVSAFPNELFIHVRSLIEIKYRNIVQYTYQSRGGHFAAFEEPQLMADDIKAFVKTVERL